FLALALLGSATVLAKTPAHPAAKHHAAAKPAAKEPAEPAPSSEAKPPAPATNEQGVPNAPTLTAKSYVLMDFLSGQVLAQKDGDTRVAPASITKIMTSYVVANELKNGKIKLDDPVYVSEKAWRGGGAGTDGSTSFLQVNKSVPVKDLMYGMII